MSRAFTVIRQSFDHFALPFDLHATLLLLKRHLQCTICNRGRRRDSHNRKSTFLDIQIGQEPQNNEGDQSFHNKRIYQLPVL